MRRSTLVLCVSLNAAGHDPAAWRRPTALRSQALDGLWFGALARLAEDAGLDFVMTGYPPRGSTLAPSTSADAIRLDPLSLAAALIGQTRRIGLVAAASAVHWEPFHVARAFSALDHLSGGRAGWLVEAVAEAADVDNFNRLRAVAPVDSPERTREFVEVVGALWDSWDDDALVLDKAQARFTDHAKVRRIDHGGRHFTVEGPLNSPRPVQGRPPIFQVVDTDADAALAVATADVALIRASSGPRSRRLRTEAAALGREILVLADLEVALDRDGAAEALTDSMEAWAADGACDGFNLLPAAFPDDLEAFARDVAPALHARGLRRTDYDGASLRDHLGLARPARLTRAASAHG